MKNFLDACPQSDAVEDFFHIPLMTSVRYYKGKKGFEDQVEAAFQDDPDAHLQLMDGYRILDVKRTIKNNAGLAKAAGIEV